MPYYLLVLQRRSLGIAKPDPMPGKNARRLVAWCSENAAAKCALLHQIADLEPADRKAALMEIEKLIQIAASGQPVPVFYDEKQCHKTHSFEYKGKTRDVWRVRRGNVRVTFCYGRDKVMLLTHAFPKHRGKLSNAQKSALERAVEAFVDAEEAGAVSYVKEDTK